MLTIDDVVKRVKRIDNMRGDDEGAHSEEDKLHIAVLRAIAKGNCDDPVSCAREALKTLKIAFARWCA